MFEPEHQNGASTEDKVWQIESPGLEVVENRHCGGQDLLPAVAIDDLSVAIIREAQFIMVEEGRRSWQTYSQAGFSPRVSARLRPDQSRSLSTTQAHCHGGAGSDGESGRAAR